MEEIVVSPVLLGSLVGAALRSDYLQIRRLVFCVGGDSGQRRSRSRQCRVDNCGHGTNRPGRAAAAFVGQPGGNGNELVVLGQAFAMSQLSGSLGWIAAASLMA
jgi:hypothetical protein